MRLCEHLCDWLERWQAFFREVVSLVTAGERHYGVCNANYSDYMIERFELSISLVTRLAVNSIVLDHVRP